MKASKTAVAVAWDTEIAAYASQQKASGTSAANAGSYISLANQTISFGGQEIGDEVQFVVLGHMHENAMYSGPWDPNNLRAPVCWAVGQVDSKQSNTDMKPNADIVDDAQNESCYGCPMNEFGTAQQGQGKACKNTTRIALLAWNGDDDSEAYANSPVCFLRTPVTSRKNWLQYAANNLFANPQETFGAAITRLEVRKHKKYQIECLFNTSGFIADPELVAVIRGRFKEAAEALRHGLGNNKEIEATAAKTRDDSKRAYARGKTK
jgi:uncharacterized membrane protein